MMLGTLAAWALVIAQTLSGGTLSGGYFGPIVGGGSVLACTVGPFVAAGAGAVSISTLNSQINGAVDGKVVCLQRGEVWSGASGLSLSTSHANSARVTVCASTGANCSDSGAANPRITITASSTGVKINPGAGGYAVKNLDVYQTADANNNGWQLDGVGQHDVSVEGGVIDGFERPMYFSNSGSGSNFPTNIEMGKCGGVGHWLEIRNGPPTLVGKGDRSVSWGALQNSSISIYVHNFLAPNGGEGPTSHYLDLASAEANGDLFSGGAHDVTIQCSRFEHDSSQSSADGHPMGTCLNKINRGYHLIFRDNACVHTGSAQANGSACLCFATHNSFGQEGVSGSGVAGAGASIYRNTFTNQAGVQNQLAEDVDVLNNVSNMDITANGAAGSGPFGLYQTDHAGDPNVEDINPQHVRILYNTVNQVGNSCGGCGYGPLYSDQAPGVPAGRVVATTNAAVGNLVRVTSNDAQVLNFLKNCGEFGTNGQNITDNFIYTPNDTTPAFAPGCSGTLRNSNQSPHVAGFNIDPLLVSVATGDFHETSSAANTPYKFSNAAFGPPVDVDYDQHAQTSPNTAGAFANVP